MTFDEQIKRTLQENSEWTGSADVLWEKVASRLKQEQRWWMRRPLWLSTVAAATVLLAVMVHSMLTPPPRQAPEPAEFSRMQTFSALMLPEESLVVQKEEPLELALDIYLAAPGDAKRQPLLLLWKQEESGDVLAGEYVLSDEDLFGKTFLAIKAPAESGSYRVVVQGTFYHEEQLYVVFTEKSIVVKGENEDENIAHP